MQAERKRPDGVTILGIFGIISGILGIILGSGLAILGPMFSQFSETDISDNFEVEEFPDTNSTDIATALDELKKLSGSIFILGIILIPLAIASIIVSWGLLKGKGWAWIGAVVLTIISIIFSVLSNSLIGIGVDATSIGGTIVGFIIYGIILWYLYRPNVRSYFGRVKIQTP